MAPRLLMVGKWLAAVLGTLVAVAGLYLLAGVAGSLIPDNKDWSAPKTGVRIFVRTNGVHTWLVLPKRAAGIDMSDLSGPAHIRDPRYAAGDYLGFGFGNREFYLNTPTWADLRPATALVAAVGGGPGLMHVDHVWRPRANGDQHPIVLTPDQYRRLAAFVRQSFVLTISGRSQPLTGTGYGAADTFYAARGRYDAYRNCNEWVGEGLRTAGVKVGIWTPFTQSIMWRFD